MNNEQSELAKRVQRRNEEREAQKTPTPQISQIEVRAAAWVWQLGVVAIDITTAYIVWQITMLFYGILWMLAGALSLLGCSASSVTAGQISPLPAQSQRPVRATLGAAAR